MSDLSQYGIHRLKTWPEFYKEVLLGTKTFEIRKNDRAFKVGDLLILQEWSPERGYTYREEGYFVRYITDWEQKPGYVVMGRLMRGQSMTLTEI